MTGGSANALDYGDAEPLDHYDLGGRRWGHHLFRNTVSFFNYRSWIGAARGGAGRHRVSGRLSVWW